MKNAPITYGNESALDKREYTIGDLLMRKSTVLAGVLARLLQRGGPLTAWDGVEEFRTLHLDAAIRTLKKKYGWPIESVEIPTYKPNGTIYYVTGYVLPQAAVDQAYKNKYLGGWLEEVKVEQVRKRAIDDAKAAALDFYRLTTGHPAFHNIAQYLYHS
jgi:hypothetical protein